jgi:hypothetical protein
MTIKLQIITWSRVRVRVTIKMTTMMDQCLRLVEEADKEFQLF